jgi:hypothetical protein
VCAVIGLTRAVVISAGRPPSRWRLAAVAAAVTVAAALAVVPVVDLFIDRRPWEAPADPASVLIATAPMICAVVLGALAAATAVATGRRLRTVGLGLVPLVLLALITLGGVASDARFHRYVANDDAFLAPGLITSLQGNTAAPMLSATWDGERPAIAVLMPGVRYGAEGADDGPRLWPPEEWTLGSSWTNALPALMAMLCVVGIAAVVGAVPPGRPPDYRVDQGR